ncbi:hypothetical protein BJY00DRAFT_312636 [Aspergillus carlsbadensis]|nr:hypothetical protein BJY00DRAFT_312636 [Aspergillus carlsbadensis]
MFLVNYLTQPKVAFPAKIDYPFESQIARLLDEAGVPNFMWGEPYLGILGSSTAFFFSMWVVPDHLIDQAGEALAKASFPPCKHGRDTCTTFHERITHPYPDHHFHTDLTYPDAWPTLSAGVHLYKKSRLFWEFSDPTPGPPPPNDPYYMLAGDPRIRTGNHFLRNSREPKPAGCTRSKSPCPRATQIRDYSGQPTWTHWTAELIYLTCPTHILDFNLDLQDVRAPFRQYLVALATGGGAKPRRALCQVYLEMKGAKRIPPPERPPVASRLQDWSKDFHEFNIPFKASDLE